MKTRAFRMLCALLAVLTLCGAASPAVSASSAEEDAIFYGNIQIQGVNDAAPMIYRAARDQDGYVYIQMDDYAVAIGGTAEADPYPDAFRYRIGCWNIIVYTHNKTAEVYYSPNGSTLGYCLYGQFQLRDCLRDPDTGLWYFPLEEMLYLSRAQWVCQDQTVFLFRPETLLDVLADMTRVSYSNPTYVDIMGADAWDQLGNSFKYGFQAAIDDLDMTFILDSILTTFSFKDSTSYEDDVLASALLMLRSDAPEDGSFSAVNDGFEATSNFVSGISTTLDLSTKDAVFSTVQSMLGLSVSSDLLSTISDYAGVGSDVIGYALGVGQALYTRENMPESFGARLKLIEEFNAERTEDEFSRRLASVSQETYKTYYGEVRSAYMDGVNLDTVVGLIDGVAKLGGVDLGANDLAITPLRWADLAVSVFDTGVEVMKTTCPAIQKALDEAEDIHLSLDLVNLSTIMNSAYEQSIFPIRQYHHELRQSELDSMRITAQVTQCAAMHAHALLVGVGKMPDHGSLPEQAFLQRLSESAKYDALLLLDSSFNGLRAQKVGCIRVEIPPEYVFGLPLIDFEYTDGMTDVEVTPLAEDVVLPDAQKLYVTTDTNRWGVISTITLRHATYGEYTYESTLGPWEGDIFGVDMGDGQYTYVLTTHATGTIGGSEIVILRPVEGRLEAVKIFDLYQRTDDIYVEGSFGDSATLSVTVYPSGATFTGTVEYPMAERTGTEIHENGTGFMAYELNEDGFYDLIFCTAERNLYNIDVVGSSSTRYKLVDGQLVITEQTYTFY